MPNLNSPMEKDRDTKIDVLLIDPPWYRFFGQQSSIKPLGICSLAAVLEKHGFNVLAYNADMQAGAQVIDAFNTTKNYQRYLLRISDYNDPVWQDIKNTILRYHPQFIGISVLTAKYKPALKLARLIRTIDPRIKIIAGGVYATLCPEEMLDTGEFDVIVRGEGEYTLVDVLNALKKKTHLSDIKGISYELNGKIIHNPQRELIEDLDELPWPANHLILNKNRMLPTDFGYLMATRGCPYGCIFCASHKIWGHKVRFRSPQNIVDEIKMLKENYAPVYFFFQDDSFSIKRSFVQELCELIISEKLNIRWVCETRVDLIDDDLIEMMRGAGCFKIALGVESGNETTLLKIRKEVTKEQIRGAVKVCKRNNMEIGIFFMIGFPWETEKEINDTVNLMEELDPEYAVFSVATPYPGTELYQICRNEGLLVDKPDWSAYFHQSPEMFLTNKLSKSQTRKIIKDVERRFVEHNKKKHKLKLLSPPRILREFRRFYKHPKELLSKIKYMMKGIS